MNVFEHVDGEWEIPEDIIRDLEAIEHLRRERAVRSSGTLGGYVTQRRPFMGPGPLDCNLANGGCAASGVGCAACGNR